MVGPSGPIPIGPMFISGGGGRGATGPAGPAGPQGPAGPAGTKAATVVVDPSGGGDAATIAGGLALLPAAGGYLYIREGTYAESGLTLPDADVVIRGSGRGSTVITPGAGLSAFTIPGTVTAGRRYLFEDLTVTGAGTGETYLTVSENVNIISQRVSMSGIRFAIDRSGFFDPLTFAFIDSQIDLDADAGSDFHRSFGGDSFATWINVDASAAGTGGNFGNTSGGLLTIRNSRVTGPTAVRTWTQDNVNWDGFRTDRIALSSTGTNGYINNWQILVDGRIGHTGASLRLTNSRFINSSVTGNSIGGTGSYVENCEFDGAGSGNIGASAPTSGVVANCTFTGNTLRGMTVGATATRVRVHHNRFLDAVSVVEIAGADFNLYHGNSPFPAPTILGASSLSADNIT